MNIKRGLIWVVLISLVIPVLLMAGCTTPPKRTGESTLTPGEVKRQITKGETTQAEILSVFGSPNLVTQNKEGKEVWAYNRMSYETFSGGEGATLILIGGSKAVTTATTKSFDLILTFDEKDVVEDYKVIYASY